MKKLINKKKDSDEVSDAIKKQQEKLAEKGGKKPDKEESKKGEPEDKKEDKIIEIKESQIDSYEDKIRELTIDAKRIQAEFENFKKRSDKEKEELRKYAQAEIISRLLPVADSLEQAMKNSKDDKGLTLIRTQLMSILEKEGVRPIECIGKKCDPNYHDILMKEESDKPEDCVIEELQKGYMFKDKVLRHSMVKVAKKKCEKKDEMGKNKEVEK